MPACLGKTAAVAQIYIYAPLRPWNQPGRESYCQQNIQQAGAKANGLDEWQACLLVCERLEALFVAEKDWTVCESQTPRAGVMAVDGGCSLAIKPGSKDDSRNVSTFNDESGF